MALIRNAALNIVGLLAPVAVAVVAVPVLLARIGPERFGVVSIAWVLIGYFGVLDLGLGRALTQAVAAHAQAPAGVQAAIARKAARIMTGMGVGWGLLLAALTPLVVRRWLNLPAAWSADAAQGFWWLSLAVPAVMYANARLAEIEGRQNFGLLTAIRVPLGVLLVLAPMLASLLTSSLGWILGSIAAVRIGAAFALRGGLRGQGAPRVAVSAEQTRALFRMGGWLTVSNILSPLMTYCDRFYIASALGTAAVAYYAVPYDVLIRLTTFPFAALGVLFPLLSSLRIAEHAQLVAPLQRAWRLLLSLWLPGMVLVVVLGKDVLQLWVGGEYVRHSLDVWLILSLGIFANGLAFLPFNLIQATGRTDLTAKLHLVEFPCYLALLYFSLAQWGLPGVALAWTVRGTADCVLLFLLAARLSPALEPVLGPALRWLGAGFVLLCGVALIAQPALRYLLAAAALLGLILAAGGEVRVWRERRRHV